MRFWKFLLPLLASTLCFAAQADRISSPIDSSHAAPLARSHHIKAQPQYDLGVADPSLELSYITLLMAPSPSQQKDLDQLLAQQQDRSSPLYHQWLTPQQFADRFGLGENDLKKVAGWLKSEGFQILSLGGGHNSIIFSGTAAQVQHAFGTEIHNYRVNGEAHIANSAPVMIPAALNGIVRSVMGLHDFRPQPFYRARGAGARRNAHPDYFDSDFLWPNFLAPGDIATVYNINPLYSASTPIDGTGQKLAIAGQTDIFLDDINDFRSGFGLAPIPTTGSGSCTTNTNGIVISPCTTTNFSYVLVGTDPLTVSSNDIGEADLDIEWSGAVARNAQVIFVNAPRTNAGVFDALTAAINPPAGPPLAFVVSASYGEGCEAQASLDLETVLQQGNAEGVTIMNSSGDVGSATCDFSPPNAKPPFNPAVGGLGVSYPASSPEVTAVGGTEITIANDANPPDPSLWGTTIGANGGTAVTYIPEIGWNDDEQLGQFCAANPTEAFCHPTGGAVIISAQTFQEDYWLSIGGGGASNCWYSNGATCLGPGAGPTTGGGFAQPAWQQGLSVPGAPAGVRYVPDVSLYASANFPGYIFCTPVSPPTNVSTCASGIFTAVDADQSLVGGTSVSSPIFAGIVALLNQYVVSTGFQSTAGLGNINPTLYSLAATPSNNVFHPVTSGDNNVYCKPNTPSGQPANVQCPTAGVMGYSASNFDTATQYNLVTGLGSVNVDNLAIAWTATAAPTTTLISTTSTTVSQGTSVTFTATVTPSTATGTVSFFNNGSATALGSASLSGGTATFLTSALPAGTDNVTATYNGDPNDAISTSVLAAVVTVTAADFALTAGPLTPASVSAGQSASATLTVARVNGSGTVTFTPSSCTGLPAGATCSFSSGSVAFGGVGGSGTTTLTISTLANMAASGPQTITITGTASGTGGASHTTTVSLTVTATTETFTLTSTASTFPVTVGGQAQVNVTVNSTTGFIVGSGAGATTALPLTYTCSGSPSLATSEISCQISPGGSNQPTNATAVTVTLVTTAPTAQLHPPVGGVRIFYALLLPGLFGVILVAGSRKHGLRLLCLIVVLGFSTLWLGSCGGNSTNSNPTNPGTPVGTYTVTISATTGGASPVANSNAPFTIQLVVN